MRDVLKCVGDRRWMMVVESSDMEKTYAKFSHSLFSVLGKMRLPGKFTGWIKALYMGWKAKYM